MNFFKVFIATVLGVLASLVLLFLFFFVIALSSGGGEKAPYIREQSYLEIPVKGDLPYRTIKDPFAELFGDVMGSGISVHTLVEVLEQAKSDERIEGIHLKLSGNAGSWVHYQEAREKIVEFKEESGKWVYASTDDIGYTEAGFYLASAADSVFSPPESIFEFDGMSIQGMFYTGLLEKIGVEPVIVRSGKYKSAVEPYIRKDYSENNRAQLEPIVNQRATLWVNALAEKSGKSQAEIDALVNNSPGLSVGFALEQGFIDAIMYEDQMDSLIAARLGLDSTKRLSRNKSTFKEYKRGLEESDASSSLAVLFASGQISPVSSDPFSGGQNTITGTATLKEIEKIKKDDTIKGLVVYIDSPGGAASTSDVIWRGLKELNKEKPVFIYMGSVAASGGYYMAAAGQKIVAHPQTITGSIGVFGQFFNAEELLNDKMGITTDAVNSHQSADWLSLTRTLTETERAGFGRYVDETYETFLSRVAEARGMSRDEVHEVAQGRVWTGTDALEVGLVDSLGTLHQTLDMLAAELGLEEYKTKTFPKEKDLAELILSQSSAQAAQFLGLMNPVQRHIEELYKQVKARNGLVMMQLPVKLIEN